MSAKRFHSTAPFYLESGQILPELEVAYHTYGTLNDTRSNVVWVCHALTANSDVFDWWAGLFGENDLFNPDEYFIVCPNNLGSCYGTTGPASINPLTGQPYFHDFPFVTIRDMVVAHQLLAHHLGINTIHLLIGGSQGGQQALEWAIIEPDKIINLALLATNAQHSPWGIAFNESQRMAIATDPTWTENHIAAGLAGMKTARSIALLSYRHYDTYGESQRSADPNQTDGYPASSYQQYQGEKLARRFNAFSYWTLSKAMDSHHTGRGRGQVEEVLKCVSARTIVIGISSDLLFPVKEQEFLSRHIPDSTLRVIDSYYGHDGFLTETTMLSALLKQFLGIVQPDNLAKAA